MKLTIGMAVFDDFDGVYLTIQNLRLNHDLRDCELLVVDNAPARPAGAMVKDFCAKAGAKYIPMPEATGTTQPRERIFREAKGAAVLVMDSHVLPAPGTIARLKEFYAAHPECLDLLSGPILLDDLRTIHTHFDPVWRSEMWGTWGTDSRGRDPESEPFDIWGQGLGLFTCRREAWLGFNPHFRGFGGEEGYIHLKFRQAGRRCLCLPWLRWGHRFGRPNGVKYPLTRWNKVRNYVLGHQELGLPLDPIFEHFVSTDTRGEPLAKHLVQVHGASPPEVNGKTMEQLEALHRTKKISREEWDHLVADPIAHVQPPKADCPTKTCGGNREQPAQAKTLDELFTWVKSKPRDLDQHADKIRELASQAKRVVAFVKRREWNVLLAAGLPEELHVFQREEDALLAQVHAAVQSAPQPMKYTTVVGLDADSIGSSPIEGTDLLVLDTVHHADRLMAELAIHAEHVTRRILIRGTGAFGETAEGGGPGLLPALRHFLREHPEWSVIYHTQSQYGLTIISRDPADKPALPGVFTMAANLTKAMAAHVADGLKKVDLPVLESRLNTCTLCDQRRDDRCAVCGCYVAEKAALRSSECPLGKWPT